MRRFSAVVALLVCLGMGSFAAAQQQEFYISEVVVEGGVTRFAALAARGGGT